ncbi:MAG: hypothetical protein KKA19_00760, partial [Candidatus Margulisbacteria bacterium]|nr:hypothetical protein [Candidatus Margulisiibacteriota bacterium]
MDNKGRAKKRVIIIFVYLLIFAAIIALLYLWLSPKETCLDGIKNQNEEDVDCGGVCKKCEKIETQDLVVSKAGAVESGIENQFDLYAEVHNPNNVFGNKSFDYEFIFKDYSGAVVSSRKGEDFILPGETKNVIELNVPSRSEFSSIEFKITNLQWMEFNEYYEKPQLKITNKNYTESQSADVFGEVRGLLKNDSPYDFSLINIKVILRDANDNILALNSTEVKTVRTGEEREFMVLWPKKFSGTVMKVDVYPEVNIFDSES